MRIRVRSLVLAALVLLPAAAFLAAPLAAQAPSRNPPYRLLVDTMLSMRDGVRLHTAVYVPEAPRTPLAILFERTPYGIAQFGQLAPQGFPGDLAELAADGYAIAAQDIRGKNASEGTFVMQRPPREDRADPRAVDEATDTYDTIEWLVHRVPGSNGKVGMLGVSYDGWLTVQTLYDPHPALTAISPQASPADMWIGDDFHHGGAFRLSYGFEYAYSMEAGREWALFPFDRADVFEWYLALGPLSRVDSIFGGRIPTWRDFAAHPDYDAFWQRQAAVPNLRRLVRRVAVPTLNVAGWWDQEDFYGPIAIYRALEERDSANLNFLVVGPWNHGGWRREGRRLGAIDFGAPTGLEYRQRIERAFFACWLKGEGNGCRPAEATVWRGGENRWVEHDSWPPRTGTQRRPLYFREDGRLSFEPPTAAAAADSFVSDPAHPVPYRARPIQPTYGPRSRWSTWLLQDQRFVQGRPDVLSWATEPLAADVTIAGEITARLFASTSGSDADWVVKLVDVYPEDFDSAGSDLNGFELMVANDVFRGRYLDGYERPRALRRGVTERFAVDLHTQEYTFRRGHRIMVQVQSTWFPLIDRNPQRFVPNIFEARAADFVRATHVVHRSRNAASRLELQVATP